LEGRREEDLTCLLEGSGSDCVRILLIASDLKHPSSINHIIRVQQVGSILCHGVVKGERSISVPSPPDQTSYHHQIYHSDMPLVISEFNRTKDVGICSSSYDLASSDEGNLMQPTLEGKAKETKDSPNTLYNNILDRRFSVVLVEIDQLVVLYGRMERKRRRVST
jgi:hypothetical protein